MSTSLRLIVAASLLVSTAAVAIGAAPRRDVPPARAVETARPPQPPTLESQIDELVGQLRSAQQIPGLAIAVVVDGARVVAKGYGSASIAAQRPVTADTRFRTASVSKAFTAAAVLQLAEKGRLDLDRPARDYCRELAPLNAAPDDRKH